MFDSQDRDLLWQFFVVLVEFHRQGHLGHVTCNRDTSQLEQYEAGNRVVVVVAGQVDTCHVLDLVGSQQATE